MNRFRIEDEAGTLKEVWVGILLWGCVCELAGVFFVSAPLSYSLGILIGTATAAGYGYHMLWALEQSIDAGEAFAQKFIRKHSVIRYLVLVILMLVLIYTETVNPLSWFLALMGVKAAAYLQPVTHKILLGKEGRLRESRQEAIWLREYEEKVAKEGYPDDEDEEDTEEGIEHTEKK